MVDIAPGHSTRFSPHKEHGTVSAPDDSYATAPTWELIDDLLDNRPEVYQRAKKELLGRLGNTKKERLIELVEMEADNPPRE